MSIFNRVLTNSFFKYKNVNDIKQFNFNKKKAYCKITNIYDGDSFKLIFFHNFDLIKYKCRALGYDSPEMRPLKINPNREIEKKFAVEARDYLINKCDKYNNIVYAEMEDFDKYGRILVNIYSPNKKEHINEIMLKNTRSIPYFGGKKNKIDFS